MSSGVGIFRREIYWGGRYTKGWGVYTREQEVGKPDEGRYARGQGWVYQKGWGGVGMYTHPQTWDLGYPPSVLTPSGVHHNAYICQVGGTHPTGMLSCYLFDYHLRHGLEFVCN